jgi:hypothetical protein
MTMTIDIVREFLLSMSFKAKTGESLYQMEALFDLDYSHNDRSAFCHSHHSEVKSLVVVLELRSILRSWALAAFHFRNSYQEFRSST